MGPPKKKLPKIKYSIKLSQCDYFEYRWNETTQSYYFFNPYTGETIFCTDTMLLDRSKSMWAVPDKVIEKRATATTLYPEYYGSKRWGRRSYTKFTSRRLAAICIQALGRGYLSRLHLSQYYSHRYSKILCEYSGYYYYFDKYTVGQNIESSWYKPRLAFPWDIKEYIPNDPEDYLHGDKYSYRGFEFGPYVIKDGVGQKATQRAETFAFIKPNDWRDHALDHPKDINLEETSLGNIIPWMDGLKSKCLVISEYVILVKKYLIFFFFC